jgi:hypothetical protein
VEVGEEAQSMERNDLQLITTENPSEVPKWVAPFDSAQLRSLLAATIPLSHSSNWWFALSNSTPTPSQLLLLAPNSPDDSSNRKKRKLTPMFVSGKPIRLTEFPYSFANL